MKAKIKETGEIVDVYYEPQHGQKTNIFKEAVWVNGRTWQEDELEFEQNTLSAAEPVDLEQAADAFALKKYPSFTAENYDLVMAIRKAYANGFKAGAEWQKKQDELTWQDVKQIVNIADMLIVSNEPSKFPTEKRFYEEVLKEYNNLKNKEI